MLSGCSSVAQAGSGLWKRKLRKVASELRYTLPTGHDNRIKFLYISGRSSVGRVSAFQADCREFESRRPLFCCNLIILYETELTTVQLTIGFQV